MTFSEFIQTGPCLEEMDGFRTQRMKEDRWSHEDQRDYLVWEDRLRRGLEVPAPSRLERSWRYKRGKKAETFARRKGPA